VTVVADVNVVNSEWLLKNVSIVEHFTDRLALGGRWMRNVTAILQLPLSRLFVFDETLDGAFIFNGLLEQVDVLREVA
jgi:hypothetical protein